MDFGLLAFDGIAFDEIIVESNLNVRKKPGTPARRLQRSVPVALSNTDLDLVEQYVRQKRQFNNQRHRQQRPSFNGAGFNNNPAGFDNGFNQNAGFGNPFANPNYGSSASSANANSQSQGFGPAGFGAAAAQAQAQGFQSQGPLGGFGASAANSGTQSFQAGPNGLQVKQSEARTKITFN